MEDLTRKYKEILLNFDKIEADIFFKELIDQNENDKLIDCINNTLIEIGTDWENETIALSQVYISGTITEELIDKYLAPKKQEEGETPNIGIVTLGDFHILGKKIVKSILQSSNIKLIDFGHGINCDQVVKRLQKTPVKLLLVSVLMYPTALEVKNLCQLIRENNMDTKIMVGGAPFNFDLNLWKQVDADAMGQSPADAINYIKELKLQ